MQPTTAGKQKKDLFWLTFNVNHNRPDTCVFTACIIQRVFLLFCFFSSTCPGSAHIGCSFSFILQNALLWCVHGGSSLVELLQFVRSPSLPCVDNMNVSVLFAVTKCRTGHLKLQMNRTQNFSPWDDALLKADKWLCSGFYWRYKSSIFSSPNMWGLYCDAHRGWCI